MRVVLYSAHFQPVAVMDLSVDELEALRRDGPFTVVMEHDPLLMQGADQGAPMLVTVAFGAFTLPDGAQLPFLSLRSDEAATFLATDFLGAFPEHTTAIKNFRWKYFDRLTNLLSFGTSKKKYEAAEPRC
jgi:hypothetical protein